MPNGAWGCTQYIENVHVIPHASYSPPVTPLAPPTHTTLPALSPAVLYRTHMIQKTPLEFDILSEVGATANARVYGDNDPGCGATVAASVALSLLDQVGSHLVDS